jgi:hypothetical protein
MIIMNLFAKHCLLPANNRYSLQRKILLAARIAAFTAATVGNCLLVAYVMEKDAAVVATNTQLTQVVDGYQAIDDGTTYTWCMKSNKKDYPLMQEINKHG